MDYLKFTFQASHSLADALSYELAKLGAEGVSVVDKEELALSYKDRGELNYAMDEYLASLPDLAEITGYFRQARSETGETLIEASQGDYVGETYETRPKLALSQEDLLAKLHLAMKPYLENLGGSYSFQDFSLVKEEDWANNWKQYYKPLALGQTLTVCPSWIDYQPTRPGEIVLVLDPGQAFGTGYHESTELCAFYIENLAKSSPEFFHKARALDLGTGSGILAIILAKLGLEDLEAIDIDPQAVKVAGENLNANGLDFKEAGPGPGVLLYTGELKDTEGDYDLIVANLIASLHIDLASSYRAKLRPQGRLILSGIIDSRMPEVRASLASAGLDLVEARMKNSWWTLLAARTEDIEDKNLT